MNSIKSYLSLLSIILLSSCGIQEETVDANIIKGEIIIDLKENITPKVIENSFSKYDLIHSKNLSPSLNINLYKFDSNKIALEKLIIKVKKNENVENAQSNKTTTNRN